MPDFIAIDEINNNIDLQTNNILNASNNINLDIGISNLDLISIKPNVPLTDTTNYFNIQYPLSTISKTNIWFPYYNNFDYVIYYNTSDESIASQTKASYKCNIFTHFEYKNANFTYRKSYIYNNEKNRIDIINNYIEPYVGPISNNIITISNAYGATKIPIFKSGWYHISANYYSISVQKTQTRYTTGHLETCIYFDIDESNNNYIDIFLYSATQQADISIKKDDLNFNIGSEN